MSTDPKNSESTYPKNLTQPILVRKSYLYLGTPPRIKIKKAKQSTNLVVKTKVKFVEYLKNKTATWSKTKYCKAVTILSVTSHKIIIKAFTITAINKALPFTF